MNKIPTFLFGVVLGAILMFVSLKYHVVRATDGFHLVPKVTANLGAIYSDVREFTLQDWKDHRELVLAISNSDNLALQEEAAKGALGNTVEEAWNDWSAR